MLAPSQVFTVNSNQSVQEVINKAPDNSRIILEPGIYRERLIILGKRIQLVAQVPPTFSATSTQSAPSFSVVFDGNGAKPAWNGGQSMILVENSGRLERNGDSFSSMISGIEIRNNGDINRQGQSAGITVNASDLIISGNYLHDLQAHDGAAISVQNNSRVTAVNNLIWSNQAKRFGAVFDTNSTSGSIYSSNHFKANQSAEGNAFYQDFGTGFFLSNLVADGVSREPSQPVDSLPSGEAKGAVMLRKNSTQSLLLNQFINNQVVSSGKPHSGAINIETEGTANTILLNSFIANSVGRTTNATAYGETGSGGAIGIFNKSTPSIRFNLFSGNAAGYGGSAIAISEFSIPTIANNLFLDNVVQQSSSDSPFSPRTSAGTLFLENTGRSSDPQIYSNYFESNSAGKSHDIFLGHLSSGDLLFNTFADGSAAGSGFSNLAIGSVALSNSPSNSVGNPYTFAANTFVPRSFAAGVQNVPVRNYNASPTQFDQNSFAVYSGPQTGSYFFDTSPASSHQRNASNLIQSAALATTDLVPNQGIRSDVQGYDRRASTVTGAVETARNSTVKEMNSSVWRFRKGFGALAHFYTASEQEKDGLIAISQQQQSQGKQVDWIFEGSATNFNVSLDPLINYTSAGIESILSPVYRFFNPLSGTHLYTIDSLERDAVLITLPHYRFEGIVYYALNQPGASVPAGASSLHRFFNTQTNSHFYTADPNEFNAVFANQAQLGFRYDGLSFTPGL